MSHDGSPGHLLWKRCREPSPCRKNVQACFSWLTCSVPTQGAQQDLARLSFAEDVAVPWAEGLVLARGICLKFWACTVLPIPQWCQVNRLPSASQQGHHRPLPLWILTPNASVRPHTVRLSPTLTPKWQVVCLCFCLISYESVFLCHLPWLQ